MYTLARRSVRAFEASFVTVEHSWRAADVSATGRAAWAAAKKAVVKLITYERQRRAKTRAPGSMTPTSMTRIAAAA